MIEFIDRLPGEGKIGRKQITHSNGDTEYVILKNADEPITIGTPINRQSMMAVQGFQNKSTIFNSDGSILETDENGYTLKTIFNSDNSVTEIFTGEKTITKKTTFNTDGSITEELI